MADIQKYWYFKFTKEFILNNCIQRIKDAYEDGHRIILVYVELCAIAIEGNGEFYLKNIGPDMFVNKIARRINESEETVSRAIRILQAEKIISIEYTYLQDKEMCANLAIPELQNMIGASSKAADKQRIRDRARVAKERMALGIEENSITEAYGTFQNVLISEEQYKQFCEKFENAIEIINMLSLWLEKKRINPDEIGAYAYLIQFAGEHGITNESIKQNEELKHKKFLQNVEVFMLNDIPLEKKMLEALSEEEKIIFRDKYPHYKYSQNLN